MVKQKRKSYLIGFFLIALLSSLTGNALSKDGEFSKYTVDAAGIEITVFAFHPSGCPKTDILIAFHGLNRKAESLRNKAAPIAEKECLTVYAPLFDKHRFPNWRYHRAGVFRSGKLLHRDCWTGPILQALLDRLRKIAGKREKRVYLFGHSAGGQFLSRIAAYSPPKPVTRIVIANPSVYVLPLLDTEVPAGFGGLFSEIESRQRIKEYLFLPITIYLGQMDTNEKYLVKTQQASRQGKTRLERGRYVFNLAEQVALENGWDFNWKLVEAPDVGHSSKGMLLAPELHLALHF